MRIEHAESKSISRQFGSRILSHCMVLPCRAGEGPASRSKYRCWNGDGEISFQLPPSWLLPYHAFRDRVYHIITGATCSRTPTSNACTNHLQYQICSRVERLTAPSMAARIADVCCRGVSRMQEVLPHEQRGWLSLGALQGASKMTPLPVEMQS